jgi:Uma2 family endonuclease
MPRDAADRAHRMTLPPASLGKLRHAEWTRGAERGYRMGMALSIPRYTVDQLDRFPDDGNRYELLDGMLLVTPLAEAAHQVVAGRLHVALANALSGAAHVYVVSPGAIVAPPRTQLQPDVLVYRSPAGLATKWASVTEHWLAVEVLSPSSRIYDRQFKRDAYHALGVAEVWLVDIVEQTIEVSRPHVAAEIVRDVIRFQPATGTRTDSV